MKKFIIGVILFLFTLPAFASEKVIGSVDTSFNLIGSDDSIQIVRLNDPEVANAFIYMAAAKTGGLSGDLGLAEDKSEFELSCYATGPLSVSDGLPQHQKVASESRSVWLKKLNVVRFIDREHHRLVYLAFVTWGSDGSPKHAMCSIPY